MTTQATKTKATKPGKVNKQPLPPTKVAETDQTKEVADRKAATELADANLRDALKKAQAASSRMTTNVLPMIASSIVSYLTAKHAFKLDGNKTKVTISMRELREHCYALVNYGDDDKEQQLLDAKGKRVHTGSTYFEQTVTRGIKAGMLLFEEHLGMTIDQVKGIVAPSNKLAPKLKVKNPATGKWQEVDNSFSEPCEMSIRMIEEQWSERFAASEKRGTKGKGGTGKGDTPEQIKAKAEAEAITMATLIDTGEGGNMSQRLTAIAKMIHSLAENKYPLSEGQLSNLVDIARDIDAVLSVEENKAKLGLDEAA